MSQEMNFDGLIGPTHNYAGLSFGNMASRLNAGERANPRAAALQGLAKMRCLMEMGLVQGVLPPHERPFLPALRRIGFSGSDREVLKTAWVTDHALVANVSSASNMWTANAATVSPSGNTRDGRVHLTPANLVAMPHRSLESEFTTRVLRRVFKDEACFCVHEALPACDLFGDEGAANHNLMGARHGTGSLEVFVYGRVGLQRHANRTRFPGRQTLEASQAVARLHGTRHAVFVEQNPLAIDAGAFHNDVVCVTNERLMLFHEQAFDDVASTKDVIRRAAETSGFEPIFVMASAAQMPIGDAIRSYLFNSQLITRPDGKMSLIVPSDAEDVDSAREFAAACVAGENPIDEVVYRDIRESMRNGGGPACLRLRVQLTAEEMRGVHSGVVMTPETLTQLEAWVRSHYRDRLDPDDLGDPNLMTESRTALDELTRILGLGALYDFQQG
ncbi:N-succinylarginine dihydrolase [Asticcacaulis sp. AC402]|uniref:N-succinylarginine dihydrolase n=1 Tax=Asticcacaulis sp. AC402 TaxID=1282361 RepID=UPI0003C3CEB6|nr:N-succinylarginine dihydrolase [Asticcacaulis sp. AC402]ESQ74274.1 hypothetical protein ABAC402_15010 [Asticcacaulis sp. AC402]